ncbi:undecaprenyl-diphosphatase UppP [soil metagenome]
MTITLLLQATFLGAIQGVTEFLPISSTGHLVIAQHFLGLNPKDFGLSFDMFTNIGTTTALLAFYWKDLLHIFSKLRVPTGKPLTNEEKLPWQIIGITAVVGVAGLLLEDKIATDFRSLAVIGSALIIFGAVMLWAEKVGSKNATGEISPKQAYLVGLSQILAFVPGVSRSGATISTGLFSGLSRATAARYSFLLSVPIITVATLKRLLTAASELTVTADLATFYVVGALTAGIVGYFSLRFLIGYLQKSSLAVFAYYRFALGAALLLYVWLS